MGAPPTAARGGPDVFARWERCPRRDLRWQANGLGYRPLDYAEVLLNDVALSALLAIQRPAIAAVRTVDPAWDVTAEGATSRLPFPFCARCPVSAITCSWPGIGRGTGLAIWQ